MAKKDYSNTLIMVANKIADGKDFSKFKTYANILIPIFKMFESYDIKAIKKLSDLSPENLSL